MAKSGLSYGIVKIQIDNFDLFSFLPSPIQTYLKAKSKSMASHFFLSSFFSSPNFVKIYQKWLNMLFIGYLGFAMSKLCYSLVMAYSRSSKGSKHMFVCSNI